MVAVSAASLPGANIEPSGDAEWSSLGRMVEAAADPCTTRMPTTIPA